MNVLYTLDEAAVWLQAQHKGNITVRHILNHVYQGCLNIYFEYVGDLSIVVIQHSDGRIERMPYGSVEIMPDGTLAALQNETHMERGMVINMAGIVKSITVPKLRQSNSNADQINSAHLLACQEKVDQIELNEKLAALENLEKKIGRRIAGAEKSIYMNEILNSQSNDDSNKQIFDVEIFQLYESKIMYENGTLVKDRTLPTTKGNNKGYITPGCKVTGMTSYFEVPMQKWLFSISDLEEIAGSKAAVIINKKTPPAFASALIQLLDEIVGRAKENGKTIDIQKLPGKKKQLLEVAAKYNAVMDVSARSFSDYLTGYCKFTQGRKQAYSANAYTELFPEFFLDKQDKYPKKYT